MYFIFLLFTTIMEQISLINSDQKTSVSKLKTLILGGGFLVDSYDLFVINIVMVILKHLYQSS